MVRVYAFLLLLLLLLFGWMGAIRLVQMGVMWDMLFLLFLSYTGARAGAGAMMMEDVDSIPLDQGASMTGAFALSCSNMLLRHKNNPN
jgi:hypothetical protein